MHDADNHRTQTCHQAAPRHPPAAAGSRSLPNGPRPHRYRGAAGSSPPCSSGTTWNQIRGPRPAGSTMQSAPNPSSSSGAPTSRGSSSQLPRASRRRLQLIAQRGSPKPCQQVRIRTIDHELKLSSHDHSQRRAFSSFSEPGLIGTTQNSRPAGPASPTRFAPSARASRRFVRAGKLAAVTAMRAGSMRNVTGARRRDAMAYCVAGGAVRVSSSASRSGASAAPIRWKISSACRSLARPASAWPAARAHRPRPASA